MIFDNKCIEPLGEAKSIYDICAGVANELGVKEAFTEGRTNTNGWRNCTRSPARPSPNCRPRWRKPTRWACTKGTSPKTISPIKHSGTIPRPIPCPRRRAKSRSIRRASPSWRKHGPCCPVRPSPRCPSTSPTPKARSARNARSGRCSSSGTTTSSARTRPTGTAGGCRKSRRKSSGSTPSTRKPAASEFGDRVKVFNGRGVSFVKAKITPRIMPGVVSLRRRMAYTQRRREDTNGCVNVLTSFSRQPWPRGTLTHQSRAGGKSVTAPEGGRFSGGRISAEERTDS
ncbi:MAG: molybdopterin dinucleotide binding domain-containing protein [Bilophila wadsworthia]